MRLVWRRESVYLCIVMKTHVHRISSLLSVILPGILTAFSCEKNVAGAARGTLSDVEIRVDWSLCREVPEAMTVLIYTEDGRLLQSKTTPETSCVHFQLPVGTYRSGVFSYSVSEWKSLSLEGLERWETARAVPSGGRPSILACTGGSVFSVTESDIWSGKAIPPPILYPADIVHPLHIRILIGGIKHLGSIGGSLSPAYSSYLFNQTSHPREGVLPLPDAEWTTDIETASTLRNMLGPPDSLETLHLRLTLRDGSIATDTTLDIRGRVTAGEDGFRLSIGDRPGETFLLHSPGGGFEADISDWTPGEETEIIL